jgi:hypothetical protein
MLRFKLCSTLYVHIIQIILPLEEIIERHKGARLSTFLANLHSVYSPYFYTQRNNYKFLFKILTNDQNSN